MKLRHPADTQHFANADLRSGDSRCSAGTAVVWSSCGLTPACGTTASTQSLAPRFHYFALRKMHLLLRAKALVAFPGGYGTLNEVFESPRRW